MEFMGYLAVPAFVFALSAISITSRLKERIKKLEIELDELKENN